MAFYRREALKVYKFKFLINAKSQNKVFYFADLEGETMVVQHIVLIKFKPNTTEEQITELIKQFQTLAAIDGVLAVYTSLKSGK